MNLFSVKNPWVIKKSLLFAAISCISLSSFALDYRFEGNSRLGYHLVSPIDLSSHRYGMEADLSHKFGRYWAAALGAKGYAEGNHSRYQSDEILLKDAYVQYKFGPFTARVGNQQVVWGEAFGFYYADVVNPKDMREFGLGPLDKNRISSPMVNLKHVYKYGSIQLLYIPRPYFNKPAPQGSDFAFPFQKFFPGMQTAVKEERMMPIGTAFTEAGARINAMIQNIDASLLYLYYYDRNANYESVVTSPTSVSVQGVHHRIHTLGLTTSAPLGPLIIRTEVLYHKNKYFDVYTPLKLTSLESDEAVGVLGIDYTHDDVNRVGLQLSENYRLKELSGAIFARSQPLVSLHGKLGTYWEQSLDVILSYAPHDGSYMVQSHYLVPLAKRIEFLLGADFLNGSSHSEFGQYHSASRIYSQFRMFLSEES